MFVRVGEIFAKIYFLNIITLDPWQNDILVLGHFQNELFFIIYCLGLNHIFELHQLCYHVYADDTQLYVEFRLDQPVHATTATDCTSQCTADVKPWLVVSHKLLLKTVVTSAVNHCKCVQPPIDLVIMSVAAPSR